jgi:hypothetical protein
VLTLLEYEGFGGIDDAANGDRDAAGLNDDVLRGVRRRKRHENKQKPE